MSREAARNRYEAEQERLRKQQEGSSEDFEDSFIPEEPEVNPELYRDMEPLLHQGFLHQAAIIGSTSFVFKSLNHHEFEQVQLSFKMVPGFKGTSRLYSCLLAYGVWLIDGHNILTSREEMVPELLDFFGDINGAVREQVVRRVSELNRRANQSTYLTEAYAMETSSRIHWNQVRGLDLMSSSLTGIPGTEKLGYNWSQLIWRALNHVEDEKQRMEAEWENAKFVASSMAGKGISKVHAQDRRRRRNEADERRARKDKILRWALLGEEAEERTPEGGHMIVARSVEELTNQLENDLRGEKDWHDMVVEAHEKRIHEAQLRQQQYIHELHQAHIEEMNGRELVGATDLRGLSREEVDRQASERRQRILAKLNSPKVSLDPKVSQFERKWRNVLPLSHRDPSTALPAVGPSRSSSKPWRGS